MLNRSIISCGVALSALLVACVAQPADDVAGPASSESQRPQVAQAFGGSWNAPGSTFIPFLAPNANARFSGLPDVYGALVVWGESTASLPTTDRILVYDQSTGGTSVLWEETVANATESRIQTVAISEDWVVWDVRRTVNSVSTGHMHAYNLSTRALLVQPISPSDVINVSGARAVFGHSVGPLNVDRRISLWDLSSNTVTELAADGVEAPDIDGDRVVYQRRATAEVFLLDLSSPGSPPQLLPFQVRYPLPVKISGDNIVYCLCRDPDVVMWNLFVYHIPSQVSELVASIDGSNILTGHWSFDISGSLIAWLRPILPTAGDYWDVAYRNLSNPREFSVPEAVSSTVSLRANGNAIVRRVDLSFEGTPAHGIVVTRTAVSGPPNTPGRPPGPPVPIHPPHP